MDAVLRLDIGTVKLTRVPYFDVAIDGDGVGLDVEQVRRVSWAEPVWATAEGQVNVGQAVWVIETDDRVLIVDPCGAADAFIRTGPEAIGHQERVFDAMATAGVARERVDTVVLTHLDGIGLAAAMDVDGGWVPAFPNARVVVTSAELEYLETAPEVSGLTEFRALVDHGVVDTADTLSEVAPGVRLEFTGAHSPGHAIVRIDSGGEHAVLLGHLAVSPLHLAMGECEQMHRESKAACAVLDALVADARANDTVVIGPLWPYPGAVHIDANGAVVPFAVSQ